MRRTLQMIVYNGPELVPIRREWELPSVTAEEFSVAIHTGKVFQYPEGEPTNNMIYIWKMCVPENKEEEEILINLGKWATYNPGQIILKQ